MNITDLKKLIKESLNEFMAATNSTVLSETEKKLGLKLIENFVNNNVKITLVENGSTELSDIDLSPEDRYGSKTDEFIISFKSEGYDCSFSGNYTLYGNLISPAGESDYNNAPSPSEIDYDLDLELYSFYAEIGSNIALGLADQDLDSLTTTLPGELYNVLLQTIKDQLKRTFGI